MRGDGDGWVLSDNGAAYWGKHGAAGLLLRAPGKDGSAAVLLQHRAPWSHQGGTWGLPGGARDSHETPEQAAVREAHEEAGLPADLLTVRTTVVTATATGSHWTYTTVIADAAELLETVPNRESSELRWVAEDEVAELPLHPGFAASWERLREEWRRLSRCCKPSFERVAAAARGSSAPVIARTTTIRRAPAASTSGSRCSSIPPIANHGLSVARFRPAASRTRSRPGARPARFGRGRPARADAEVVDLFGRCGARLRAVVGGPADHRARADDVARDRQRQVVLAEVQHVGARRTRDVGAVVDREQSAVAARRVSENLQCRPAPAAPRAGRTAALPPSPCPAAG